MGFVPFETAVTNAKEQIDKGTGDPAVGLIITLFFSDALTKDMPDEQQRAEVVMATPNAGAIMGCDLPKKRYRDRVKAIYDAGGNPLSPQEALMARKKREVDDRDVVLEGYRASYDIETASEGVVRVYDQVIRMDCCTERLYICWSLVTREPERLTQDLIRQNLT